LHTRRLASDSCGLFLAEFELLHERRLAIDFPANLQPHSGFAHAMQSRVNYGHSFSSILLPKNVPARSRDPQLIYQPSKIHACDLPAGHDLAPTILNILANRMATARNCSLNFLVKPSARSE
jgi:hypothetical protein